MISLKDLQLFHDFLNFAFSVLHGGGINVDSEFKNCGFVKVNSESMIPYTVLESGEKGVPLFYFEGQTDILKAKAQVSLFFIASHKTTTNPISLKSKYSLLTSFETEGLFW